MLLNKNEKARKELLDRLNEKMFESGPQFTVKISSEERKGTQPMIDSALIGVSEVNDSMKKSQAIMRASESLQGMRSKYFEEWNKMQEQTRKEMRKFQEENTKMKIKVNDLNRKIESTRMEKEREIHSAQLQWKQKENSFQVIKIKLEKDIKALEGKLEYINNDDSKKKEVINDHKGSIQALKKQLKALNDEI